jgi:hypothetical protein
LFFFSVLTVVYDTVFALATIASCRGPGLATVTDIPRLSASTSSTARPGPQARPSQTLVGSESQPEKHGISFCLFATSASRLRPSRYACLHGQALHLRQSEHPPTRLHGYAIPNTWTLPFPLPAFLILTARRSLPRHATITARGTSSLDTNGELRSYYTRDREQSGNKRTLNI